RTLARAALAAGDPNAAADAIGDAPDPELRAEVARALAARDGGGARARALVAPLVAAPDAPPALLVVAGDAAAADGDWGAARDAYGRVLQRAGDESARLAASVGLLRVAAARGGQTAAAALTQVASAGDPLLRRAALASGRLRQTRA